MFAIQTRKQELTFEKFYINIFIVLLILAGVGIASLTGDNGILKQAQNTKDKTKLVDKDEREKLDKMSELVDETVNMESKVKQVTDEHPGELENVGDEKIINSIEDLIFFAYNITNGNTYEGQTVKLGLSLDLNSSKSYVDHIRL